MASIVAGDGASGIIENGGYNRFGGAAMHTFFWSCILFAGSMHSETAPGCNVVHFCILFILCILFCRMDGKRYVSCKALLTQHHHSYFHSCHVSGRKVCKVCKVRCAAFSSAGRRIMHGANKRVCRKYAQMYALM